MRNHIGYWTRLEAERVCRIEKTERKGDGSYQKRQGAACRVEEQSEGKCRRGQEKPLATAQERAADDVLPPFLFIKRIVRRVFNVVEHECKGHGKNIRSHYGKESPIYDEGLRLDSEQTTKNSEGNGEGHMLTPARQADCGDKFTLADIPACDFHNLESACSRLAISAIREA